MQLFGRQVVLQIGVAGTVGKSITGLRMRFKVDYSRTSDPHTATITVYNLSLASYAMLQQRLAIVRVLAGYTVPLQVFVGNPIKDGLSRERQGPDWVTTIQAQDGGRALGETRVEISFTTSTTMYQVYSVLLAAMGIPQGSVSADVISQLSAVQLTQGFVYSGPAQPLLHRIALSIGADGFVSDGALQIVPRDGALLDPAPIFSTTTRNLIGNPIRRADGKVEITALLDAGMRPGRRFIVQSREINGTFTAEDVTQEGDSGGWEKPFYTHLVGRPLAA